jgi:hypothetical protein
MEFNAIIKTLKHIKTIAYATTTYETWVIIFFVLLIGFSTLLSILLDSLNKIL